MPWCQCLKYVLKTLLLYFFGGNDTQTHNGSSLTSDDSGFTGCMQYAVGTYISEKKEERERERER